MDLLQVTVIELWAIHDFVRNHQELGVEWDRDFMLRVMAPLGDAQARNRDGTSLVIDSVEELWQIDRQIPSSLMIGTQPVGKNLLLKVHALILKMRKEENGDASEPSYDTSTDDRTSDTADSKAPPR